MLDYLSLDDGLEIIDQLGIGPLRDPGLLASALARPKMTVFGEDAYPDLVHKAAALLDSLARNHPLADGNKRLSWVLTRTFLRLNGHDLRIGVDAAEALVVAVAAGELDAAAAADTLTAHLVEEGS